MNESSPMHVRTEATGNVTQPVILHSSLTALRRRMSGGLPAMWHPLSASPVAAAKPPSPRVPPAARPPPSPRSVSAAPPPQQQQQYHQQQQHVQYGAQYGATVRRLSVEATSQRNSADSAVGGGHTVGGSAGGRAGPAGSVVSSAAIYRLPDAALDATVFVSTAASAGQPGPPRSYAEALEHIAGALESLAAQSTRQDCPSKGLALRLLSLQLLQLAIVAERHPEQAASAAGASAAAAAAAMSQSQLSPAPDDAPPAAATAAAGGRPRAAQPGTTERADILQPASPLAARLAAAVRAVSGAAQRNANALAQGGCTAGGGGDLPDVWDLAYEGCLELSQAAAAEELLGNWGAAAHAYSKVCNVSWFVQ